MENKPPGVRKSGFSSRSQFNGAKNSPVKAFLIKLYYTPEANISFYQTSFIFLARGSSKQKCFSKIGCVYVVIALPWKTGFYK